MVQSDRPESTRRWRLRPTVAGLLARLSLRARLAWLLSLAIAVVVAGAAYLQICVFQARAEARLRKQTRLAALAPAVELQMRGQPFEPQEVDVTLHQALETIPAGRATTLVAELETGPELLASTSPGKRRDALLVARRAMKSQRAEWDEGGASIREVAVPFAYGRGARAAVVVAYSRGDVAGIAHQGRFPALWFTPVAIIALAVLIDVMLRRFAPRPTAGLHAAVQSVASDDVDTRASTPRRDEIQPAAETAVLDQIIATLAHQMGTPLNVILGHVQMMREGEGLDSAIGRRLKIIEDQIGKVTSVLRTMIDRPRLSSRLEPTSPVRLVRLICEVVRPTRARADVRLDVRVSGAIPDVNADAIQLQIALLNLIACSLDAMPSGGTLTIALSSAGSRVRVEIGDTGPGIAPELLPRLFDSWGTTKPAGRRLGPGLSMVKNVVEAHGGSIAVRSHPGQGTVFTLELPAADPESFVVA